MTVTTVTTDEFWQRLPAWRREIGSTPPAGARLAPAPSDLAALVSLLGRIERRHRDGPESPLRVAFFGPTGAGKSKIFNSIIGETVSPAGFHRPYTRRALYWLHEEWQPIAAGLSGDVRFTRESRWRAVILIDTPDFDSVELANRDEAERVFGEADLFVFVVDALKYADASTWEWLDCIRSSGKSFRVVLNKVESEAVLPDFIERFERTFGGPPGEPVLVLPDLPIDDDTPIPASQAALIELGRFLDALGSSGADTRRRNRELFERDLDRLFTCAANLFDFVSRRRRSLALVRERITELSLAASRELEDRLITELDPGVKRELHRRVLERIERFDFLRYPRRILALPAEGLRELWWRVSGRRASPSGDGPESRRDSLDTALLATESFQSLEAALLRLAEHAGSMLGDLPDLAGAVDRTDLRRARFGHDELLAAYRSRYETFRSWAAEESTRTASELTGQHKLKFLLSQVIFNSVVIGVQIKSFGAFSFFELGIDGVMSPLVAKAVGIAISNEKVEEFERRAHAEHHRLIAEIVVDARDRYFALLDRLGSGLPELESSFESIVAYRSLCDEIAAAFIAAESPQEAARRGGRES